jgi:predicted negative regulator of RcsB-dependent stress response
LRRAEAYEFEQKRYDTATSLYRKLFDQSEEENLKAQMLANMSRSQVKKKDYENAKKNRRNEDGQKKNKDNSFLSFDSDS